MAAAPFPHRYSVLLDNALLFAEPRDPIHTGPPPQFGGRDDVWSPEELIVGAALSCLKQTFDAYARRAGIAILDWRGVGTGVLVKGTGGLTFSNIDLDVEIMTATGDEQRAEALLADAERHCIISRVLAVPIHVVAKVTAATHAA